MPQHAATFEECLNNGIINIVDSEDEFVEDKSNHQGYIRAPGHYFANVALKHNYYELPHIS